MKKLRLIIAVAAFAALTFAFSGCQDENVTPVTLSTPENFVLDISLTSGVTEYTVHWDDVEGAEYYLVNLNGTLLNADENSINVTRRVFSGKDFEISVTACSDADSVTDSASSETQTIFAPILSRTLSYSKLSDESGYSVSSSDSVANLSGELIIPDYYEGLPVKEIADYAFGVLVASGSTSLSEDECNKLTSVRLPNYLEEIGYGAFSSSLLLTEITIPDSVTTIGYYAFYDCSLLENIEFSSSLTTVGPLAFDGTKWYEDKPEGFVTINDDMLYAVKKAEGETITDEDAVIPDGIKYIAGYVYANSEITEITLPEGLVSIGSYAFAGCKKLAKITFSSTVEEIGYSAFYGCIALRSVAFAEGVKVIGERAFYGCNLLEYVVLPTSLQQIGLTAFSADKLFTACYYRGVEDEFKVISCSGTDTFSNELMISATFPYASIYFYSETEPALTQDGTAYNGNFWYYDANGLPTAWTKN